MNAVQDWHADWVIGLLAALAVLGVVGLGLLGAILQVLKRLDEHNWWRSNPGEYPAGPDVPPRL